MQTPPISTPPNILPGPAANASPASPNGAAFGQILSREVAERRSTSAPPKAETPNKSEAGKSATKPEANKSEASKSEANKAEATDKPKPERSASDAANTAVELPPASGVTIEGDHAAAEAASVELLALVANVAQLQGEDGAEAEPNEAQDANAGIDPKAGRKRSSPFAAQHAALGARANHGAQSRPDGTWSAQVDRAGIQSVEPGKAEAGRSEPVTSITATASAAPGAPSRVLTGSDFGAAVKEASQLMQALPPQAVQGQALASQLTDKLSPRVGSQGWDQALGQKVVWMVAGEQQSASLTLNPPDLGPLKVVLHMTNAQATATFIAAQPEVRQALEAAMPRLREMLEEAGIQLGQSSVESGSPEQQHASERRGRSAGAEVGAEPGDADAPAGARAQTTASGQRLVDTFA